jgi:acetoin utilization protein AcuB
MRIVRFMSKNPLFIHPEMTVTEARALMEKEHIGHFPVLDKNNKLVGIFTRDDLIRANPSAATSLDMYEISYLLSKLKVEKVMTKKVLTISENEVVEEAARIMADENVGCLPVMRDSLLVGMVTDTDLFRVFINAFGTRHKGVRLTLNMVDKPGQLAAISEAIAAKGGNIISFITTEGDDAEHRLGTIKISKLNIEQVEEIARSMPDMAVEDIR